MIEKSFTAPGFRHPLVVCVGPRQAPPFHEDRPVTIKELDMWGRHSHVVAQGFVTDSRRITNSTATKALIRHIEYALGQISEINWVE